MIFKTEVEIEWIDENYSLDKNIQNEIVKSICSQIVENKGIEIQMAVDSKLNKELDRQVEEKVNECVNDYFNMERYRVNSWGESTGSKVTINDLIDDKLTKKVSVEKLEEIIKSKVKEGFSLLSADTEKMICDNIKFARDDIEKVISAKIKSNISDSLTDLILKNGKALSLDDSSE